MSVDERRARSQQLFSQRLARALAGTGPAPIERRPDPATPAALGPAERRIWLAAQHDPTGALYNVPILLRLDGAIDPDALLAAVTELVERYEVLRRVVRPGPDGEPLAHRQPVAAVPVRVAELAEADLRSAAGRAAAEPFRLDRDCPLRVTLYRLGPRCHALLLVLHHLATDARTGGLLVAELIGRYQTRLEGGPAPDGPALQRADVAAWENQRLAVPDPAALDWWRERLADLPASLELPFDRSRTAAIDPTAETVSMVLDAELAAAVRALAAERRATVFMVLLTAWAALLARLADTDDLAVGVPFLGRRHPDADQVPGCFVDTVVIRADLREDPSGGELVDRVRTASLAAFGHAEVPFERLVEELAPVREPGVTPLVQVLFNSFEVPPVPTLPDVAVTPIELATGLTKFDLTLTLVDGGPGGTIHGGLEARRQLFDPATVDRIAGWYRHLLAALVAAPGAPVGQLSLGGPASSVTGPRRPVQPDQRLDHWIDAAVAADPTGPAVVAADASLTYAELDRAAADLAARLRAAGLLPGEPVAVLAERDSRLPVAVLATLRAGGAYLPIDPGNPAARTAAMLRQAGARFRLDRGDLTRLADAPIAAPVPATAYVIFTSGSTGQPKPVAVSHASICHYLAAVLERLGGVGLAARSGGARGYALASTPAADLGLTCLFGALVTGATLHLLDRETAVDPVPFGAHLARYPVDVLKLVPSQLQLLARHGELARVLPRRLLILAGEPTPPQLLERIRKARPDLLVQSHYGPTETTVAVLAADLTGPDAATGPAPLGRPLANAELYVVDRRGRPVPVGQAGELVIGGPGVALGYLGQPDLTAQRFGPGPAGAGRCYRTGDRVRLAPDGTLSYLGRLDDQVKIRGYRVEPGEVAAACRTLPGVAEAVVLPRGIGAERRLVAWLVPTPGAQLSAGEARRELRAQLPDQLVPSHIVVLERLPLNANGKVDRGALPAPDELPAAEKEPPGTATEVRVAAAWRAVLSNLDALGRDDDFFAAGGDSFTAVRLAAALGAPVRVVDVMAHPTIRELASFMDQHDAGDERLLQPLRVAAGTARASVVCLPYGGGSAAAYQPLAAALAADLSLYAVELPGHDPARPDESFLSLSELVGRAAAEVHERVTGPVVIYGHCVGTAAASALAQRLEQDGVPVVAVVLAASFPAARLPGRLSGLLNRLLPSDRWHSDRETRDLLRGIGGLPDDLAPEAVTSMLRALRHDAREAEAWFTQLLAQPPAAKLQAPVLSLVGARDPATELAAERYREWGLVADQVELAVIPNAGHYFLKHQADQVAGHIDRLLTAPPPAHATSATPPVTSPRRNLRQFRLMAFGQLASMIGTQLSGFGLGVWVYQQTGRVGDYALITMLALVPVVFAAPIGGAVADRFDRRRVMLVCDCLSAALMAGLAVQYALGGLRVWQIAVVVTLTSLLSAAQRPAYLAAIAQLVPKPYLPQANALAQLGTGVGALLAPFLGGALIGLVGLVGILLVDLATFLVGLVTLVVVRLPALAFHRRKETFRASIAGGWRFILARPAMRLMAAYFVPVNFLSAVTLALVAPLLLSIGSTVALGAVTAVGGLGAAAGSVLMMVWSGTRRRAVGMVGALLPAGLGTVALAVAGSPVLAGAGFFVWWAATSVLNAHWLAILQAKVGGQLLGRVLAVNQMLATAAMPAGFLLAPVAVERLTGRVPGAPTVWLLTAVGVALVVWAVLGLAYRPLRHMEDDLPDAVTGAVVPDDLDGIQAEADQALAGRP